MKENKTQILLLLAYPIMSCNLAAQVQGNNENKAPNIIFILADDLGYGDVTVYNPQAKTSTPNIDRLASQGIRFTDAHSPSAVSTPTRYGILTGRYCWRSRLPVGVLNGYSQSLIEKERTTVASLLKRNGYTTAVIGKWHLGLDWVQKQDVKYVSPADAAEVNNSAIVKSIDPSIIDFSIPPSDGPLNHGFDYSFILPASLDMPPYSYLENDRLLALPDELTKGNDLDKGSAGAFWRVGLMAKGFDFEQVTPTFTQKAISFLKKQSATGKPFFLYLPYSSPHTPWMPSAEYNGSSKAGQYGDFVNMVDAEVGKVLTTLTEMGFDDNTIVFFASDNGPFWKPDFIEKYEHRAAYIYRGMKADAFEGGHRIPFIVRWPGKIKPDGQCPEPIMLTNLLATCAGILNKNLSENEGEDSFNILPLLLGNTSEYERPEALIQQSSRGLFVIRKGDWKIILGLGSGGFSKPESYQPKAGEAPGQLFNLKEDPSETKNLYQQYPEKVEELIAILKKYKETGRSR
ncbi:MAG: arylsulfatase [Bacteroidia bacterium]|nr:arylsulfatase [Bacteroidia bacterium]